MFETVSVDEALARGRKMVNYPVMVIIVGIFVVSGVFSATYESGFPLIGIPVGFIIAWLYWSVMITKWRIWAFDNVRNVNELKARAIKEKLIWKDGSFFEKTEIRNASDRKKLDALTYKFNKPDVFNDDLTVSPETEIYYSRNKIMGEIIVGGVMVALSIYFFIILSYVIACITCIGGIILTFSSIKKLNNKTPQIIISVKGIQTAKTSFHSWGEVTGEDVIGKQVGKSRQFFLVYQHPAGSVELNIGEFGVKRDELDSLLRLYRGRYENQTTRA